MATDIPVRKLATLATVRGLINNSSFRAVVRQLVKHGGYGRCGEGHCTAGRRVTASLVNLRGLGMVESGPGGLWTVTDRPQLVANWNSYIDAKKAGITFA